MNIKPRKLTSPAISVRLTNQEYRIIQRLAYERSLSKAAVLRDLLIKEAQVNA